MNNCNFDTINFNITAVFIRKACAGVAILIYLSEHIDNNLQLILIL